VAADETIRAAKRGAEREQQKRFQEMGKTNAIFAHMPFFPTPPPFADNHFIEQTRQLIEILWQPVTNGGRKKFKRGFGDSG